MRTLAKNGLSPFNIALLLSDHSSCSRSYGTNSGKYKQEVWRESMQAS